MDDTFTISQLNQSTDSALWRSVLLQLPPTIRQEFREAKQAALVAHLRNPGSDAARAAEDEYDRLGITVTNLVRAVLTKAWHRREEELQSIRAERDYLREQIADGLHAAQAETEVARADAAFWRQEHEALLLLGM